MALPLTASPPSQETRGRFRGIVWLALVCIAYAGLAFVSRWSDWVELFAPHAVLLPAGAALYAAEVSRPVWFVYVAGAVTYAIGSGVHFATTSIAGIPSDWFDEAVIRHVWYGGVALVFLSLVAGFARRDRPDGVMGLAAYVLVLLAGLTHTTVSLDSGTVVLGCAVAALFSVWGWFTRDRLGRVLLVGYLPALVTIAALGFGLR